MWDEISARELLRLSWASILDEEMPEEGKRRKG
jgi:hypothetical protein